MTHVQSKVNNPSNRGPISNGNISGPIMVIDGKNLGNVMTTFEDQRTVRRWMPSLDQIVSGDGPTDQTIHHENITGHSLRGYMVQKDQFWWCMYHADRMVIAVIPLSLCREFRFLCFVYAGRFNPTIDQLRNQEQTRQATKPWSNQKLSQPALVHT